ncbi:MAG: efflux RND transporter permease subunit, partial [Alphaproteobacteria bacterium]|nr:efflux RND transporter permease subunit [Alphaproteobacteria bacterium]
MKEFAEFFISRPIATTLFACAIALSGFIAFYFLPVSSLPQIEFPTVTVQASLPGASPEVMASSVATPLEKQLSAIAGISEMTSLSSLGSTRITLQFDLDKDIDAASRAVQAAINATKSTLPRNLPNLPSYRKMNPTEGPLMVIALSSKVISPGKLYDFAASIVSQKLSQVSGVGQVTIGGGSLPAVRIRLNPKKLNQYNIALEYIRNRIASETLYLPKGHLANDHVSSEIISETQLFSAKEYLPLIVRYQGGVPVRLRDLGTAEDSVEDIHNAGLANGEPSIVLILFKQPGSNVITTVENVNATLQRLQGSIPSTIKLTVLMDRTTTIRASLTDVKKTMLIALLLVVLVVYGFLRNVRAALVPSVAIPLSILGTFGVMYLLGYSVNNLSLMALTIAIGFVVDDAVVVLENIMRHRESGLSIMTAAKKGTREVSFTVISMSISLIAVFIPILLLGGIIGRVFHEFAMTLSVAILISLLISLTITPMMSAHLIKKHANHRSSSLMKRLQTGYASSLSWALDRPRLMMGITGATIVLNVFLYVLASKGFFPIQDTGRITGTIKTTQNASFTFNKDKLTRFMGILRSDPAILNVSGYVGGVNARGDAGSLFISLKPLEERKVSSEEVIARLRDKLNHIPGAGLFLRSVQDVSIGGRQGTGLYQYTLTGDTLESLNIWTPKIMDQFRTIAGVVDVNSDQLDKGLEERLVIDRDKIAQFGLTIQEINNTLYDGFGQRQISTLYKSLNQYHVVLEIDPQFSKSPRILESLFITNAQGQSIPFSAFSRLKTGSTLLLVNHQSLLPASTISFSLKPGVSVGDVVDKISTKVKEINLPEDKVQGSFQGTAKAFQDSLRNQPYIILSAVLVIYIVLGILYESLIHPITILSTLPSAGVGSLLALLLTRTELNVVSLIGILLLVGIVKKNAIMMIDFALSEKRRGENDSRESIYKACLFRFRPIMMTTMAALLSALPLTI